jgi:hypothetical protein
MGHLVARHLLFDGVRGIRTCHQAAPGEDHRGHDAQTSTAASDEVVLGRSWNILIIFDAISD